MTVVTHGGACHCGSVKFEIDAPADLDVYECNCSICSRTGYLHVFVAAGQFRLLSGREELVSYRFNTRVANHLFCGTCGVKPFYVPRSHPDGYSVNLRCLEKANVRNVTVIPFDGANWETSIGALRDT